MPHFTLPLTREGPIVNVGFHVSAPRAQALREKGVEAPNLVQGRALIDTGASCTSVDPTVLDQLQLTPTGSVQVLTPSTGHNPHITDQYDLAIVIPGASKSDAPLHFPIVPVIASELLQSQGFHALIGRDILWHCVLIYNGKGPYFSLAY